MAKRWGWHSAAKYAVIDADIIFGSNPAKAIMGGGSYFHRNLSKLPRNVVPAGLPPLTN